MRARVERRCPNAFSIGLLSVRNHFFSLRCGSLILAAVCGGLYGSIRGRVYGNGDVFVVAGGGFGVGLEEGNFELDLGGELVAWR